MEAVGATSLCLAHGCSSRMVNQLVSVSQTLPEKLEMGVEDVHDAYCPRTASLLNLKLTFLKILLIATVCVLINKKKIEKNHFHYSGTAAHTWLTGRSASSRLRGGSSTRGSKLLRRRHGDSPELRMVAGAASRVTSPGGSPAGTGVPAGGCDRAAAGGS